jgi:PemK-like, MazF-like toxin of type II toxin-antitoxin system
MTTTPPSFERGDVVLALFPHSNLRSAKLRPVLVVQADDLGTGLPQLIVAMVTGNMSRSGHRSRVPARHNDSIWSLFRGPSHEYASSIAPRAPLPPPPAGLGGTIRLETRRLHTACEMRRLRAMRLRATQTHKFSGVLPSKFWC